MTTLWLGSIALTVIAALAWLTDKPGRLSKAFQGVGAMLVLAVTLSLFQGPRAWASEEGAWIYHWLWVNGPLTVYSTNTWKDAGGTTHTGLEVNSGTYAARTAVSFRFLGAMATSARPACTGATTIEGDVYYDTTVHSFAFCNGSSYYRMIDLGATYPTVGSVWTEF